MYAKPYPSEATAAQSISSWWAETSMPITSSGASVVSAGRFSSAAASAEVAVTSIAASSAVKGAGSLLAASCPPPPRPRITETEHPPMISTSSSAREPATI